MAEAVLALARNARRAFPRGGFEGLDAAELQVLLSVWLEPERLVREIADDLEMPRPSVSSALTRLEEKQLLARLRDQVDARTQRMRLTSDGATLARRFLATTAKRLAASD